MKRKLLLLVVLILALLPGKGLAQNTADWTILYYSAADNDLERFMVGDLMEMHLVGSTDQVNIVVQMDRIDGYDEVNGNFTDTRRYLVDKATGASGGDFTIQRQALIDQLAAVDPAKLGKTQAEWDTALASLKDVSDAEIEDIVKQMGSPPGGGLAPSGINLTELESPGETETGDPQTLIDFATWGISNYPAEKYMLMLSDHGGGWLGVAFDNTSGGDALTMPEVYNALDTITSQTGIGQFEVIGFDACMMGQLEVYNTVAPFAKYTIASEEVIPGSGWEYVTPLEALTQNPQISIDDLGKSIIDGYMDYYTNVVTGYSAFDLHLIDLSKVAAVNTAIEQFTAAVQANPQANLLAIGKARDNAQIFSQSDPDAARIFSTVDLSDFMRLLIDLTDDAAVKQAAQGVIDAAKGIVMYGKASAALPGSNGVAIYFPANQDDYALGEMNKRYPSEFSVVMPAWIAFLDTFYGTATTTLAPSSLTIKIDQVIPNDGSASVWDPPVVLFTTNGSGIVDLEFYAALKLQDQNMAILLDASSLEFSYTTEDGEEINQYPEGESQGLEFSWNVEMPVMHDAAGNSEITVLISNPDNPDEATVSGIYHYQNGDTTRAYLVVDQDTQKVTKVYSVQENDQGQAVGEISPTSGDTFEPHYRFLDESGQIQLIESGTQLVFSDEPFAYEFVPAADGSYVFTMWVKDLAGNISYDSVEFAVSNEGLDTTYRGFKDLGMGLNFLIPWGWLDPNVTVKDDGTYRLDVSDATGDLTIFVDTFDVTSIDDLLQIASDNLTNFGATFNEPERAQVDAGGGNTYDAYNIFYTYTTEDGTKRTGSQLVIYVPDNSLGYVIDLDSLADKADEASQVFSDIGATIIFFPPQ